MRACWKALGGALRLPQYAFTPERLAAEIARSLRSAPEKLVAMARRPA